LQGCLSTGLTGPNAHAHVTTTPIIVYGVLITPTASGGFGMVVQTNSAAQDNSYSNGTYVGYGYWGGRETSIKADLQGALAGASVLYEFPEGFNVDEQCFVTSNSAYVTLYYKRQ